MPRSCRSASGAADVAAVDLNDRRSCRDEVADEWFRTSVQRCRRAN